MRIFVTGGTGFVGKTLALALVRTGHEVSILTRSGKGETSGPVNFTAPNPVRNKELAQWLGRILGRPAFLPAPGFMLRLVLGEFGSILLEGQRVLPQKLVQAGFQFSYPEIDRALRQVVRGSGG